MSEEYEVENEVESELENDEVEVENDPDKLVDMAKEMNAADFKQEVEDRLNSLTRDSIDDFKRELSQKMFSSQEEPKDESE